MAYDTYCVRDKVVVDTLSVRPFRDFTIMLNRLFSRRIREQLVWAMLLVIAVILLTATPLLLGSYKNYKQSQQSLEYLRYLQVLANICNGISKERGPANVAMIDASADRVASRQILMQFRHSVDADIEQAMVQFRQHGYSRYADKLQQDVMPALQQGRTQIDAFMLLPQHKKTSTGMGRATNSMFDAWDASNVVLKEFLYRYHGQNQQVADVYTLTLLLTELRDQAGRLGSNIIPSLAFGEQLPEVHMERVNRNQKNIKLLWQMVDEVESTYTQDNEYQQLHEKVERLYLTQGMTYVDASLNQSQQRNFVLDSKTFTRLYVRQMSNVINLQDYVFTFSRTLLRHNQNHALNVFIATIVLCSAAIFVVLYMMYYFNRHVFSPLLLAREMLLDVSESKEYTPAPIRLHRNNEFNALFEAIHQVQGMMRQRELLASELTYMANTDSLTGLYNRMALQQQIDYLEALPDKLQHTALLVMDIDNFKSINDQHGHLTGDLAIVFIAQRIRENIRAEDFAARYGGDELIIILDHTDLERAVEMATRIQQSVATAPFVLTESGESASLSISVGVAMGAQNWHMLMARADQCLLRAKAMGKNRVQFDA